MTREQLISVVVQARDKIPHGPGDKDVPVRAFANALIAALRKQSTPGNPYDLSSRKGSE